MPTKLRKSVGRDLGHQLLYLHLVVRFGNNTPLLESWRMLQVEEVVLQKRLAHFMTLDALEL